MRMMGPAEAPVPRLKNEYPLPVPGQGRQPQALNELLQQIRAYRRAEQVAGHGAGDRRRPADSDVTSPTKGYTRLIRRL